MKLASRLMVLMGVAFTIIAGVIVGVGFSYGRAQAMEDAQTALDDEARAAANEFATHMQSESEVVLIIAHAKSSTDLQMSIVNASLRAAVQRSNLLDLLEDYSTTRFERILVLNAAGNEVANYVGGEPQVDRARSLDRARDASFIASLADPEPFTFARGGVLHFVAPVMDQRERFAGMVEGEVSIDSIMINDRHLGSKSFAIYNGNGELVAGEAPQASGWIVSNPAALEVTDLWDDEPFSIVLAQDEAHALADTSNSAAGVAIAVAIGFLVISLVLILSARHVVRPITGIAEAVGAIGRGDLATRASVTGSDELRALSTGINEMAAQLEARERERAREAQERGRMEKLATLGSVSGGVAHEVNNPLTFMRGQSELFEMAVDDVLGDANASPALRTLASEGKQFTKTNLDGIDRITRIVKALRLLARPHPGRERVDVGAVVEAARELAQARLRGVSEVTVDVPDSLVAIANTDGLGQVMLNLLLNAADVVPTANGKIRVSAEDVGDRVRLVVEDNGPGIPPDVRPHIFTPFFTTKPEGTGLGLSVSQRIVEESEGSIRFEDAPGGGTRFIIELPLASGDVTEPLPQPRPDLFPRTPHAWASRPSAPPRSDSPGEAVG